MKAKKSKRKAAPKRKKAVRRQRRSPVRYLSQDEVDAVARMFRESEASIAMINRKFNKRLRVGDTVKIRTPERFK